MSMLQHSADCYGELRVVPIGHGSVCLSWQEETIVVDPYSAVADFSLLPPATAILLTHDHYDHYDPQAIRAIARPETTLVAPPKTAERLRADGFTQPVVTLANGQSALYAGRIGIEAVPAYNIMRERTAGVPFHPIGEGNGYLLTIGGRRIYIAGDTELIPEMRRLKPVDIAFLPQMLPYTMSEEEWIEAAKIIEPQYLYPYHFESVDRERLRKALPGIIIR